MKISASIKIAFAAAVAVVCGYALYACNPEHAWWMPKCAFHALTGLQCPGCGGLRCAHQLLRGHLSAGLAYNPMLPVLLLLGIIALVLPRLLQAISHALPPRMAVAITPRLIGRLRIALAWLFVAAYLAWGIARNLLHC